MVSAVNVLSMERTSHNTGKVLFNLRPTIENPIVVTVSFELSSVREILSVKLSFGFYLITQFIILLSVYLTSRPLVEQRIS